MFLKPRWIIPRQRDIRDYLYLFLSLVIFGQAYRRWDHGWEGQVLLDLSLGVKERGFLCNPLPPLPFLSRSLVTFYFPVWCQVVVYDFCQSIKHLEFVLVNVTLCINIKLFTIWTFITVDTTQKNFNIEKKNHVRKLGSFICQALR